MIWPSAIKTTVAVEPESNFLRKASCIIHANIVLFNYTSVRKKSLILQMKVRPSLENVRSISWTALNNDSLRISMWNDRSRIAGDVQQDLHFFQDGKHLLFSWKNNLWSSEMAYEHLIAYWGQRNIKIITNMQLTGC
jgi:hypothetical protein